MRSQRASRSRRSIGMSLGYIVKFLAIGVLFFVGVLVIHVRQDRTLGQGDGGGHAAAIGAKPSLRQATKKVSDKLKVAFAITITKDGNFQDGAAVLAYSIFRAFEREPVEVSLVAFVHPNVTTSRPPLTQLGFHVIEVPVPINIPKIKYKFLREHIDKNGCCGASELIKLSSYRLLQYDKVVHLDADVEVVKPFMNELKLNKSLVYTTDPNMASHKGEDKMPVQGGFLIIKPDMDDYNKIIDTLMTTQFYQGSAWGGSKIGWFWGGMTVQGILPYYYRKISSPDRMQVLDRCYFNTMADVPECITQQVDDVTSAHFTVCQKPWACFKPPINRLCGDLHQRWYELRAGAEAWYGVPVAENACPKGGHKHYVHMQLAGARLPQDNAFFVPDTSLDRLEPTAAGRF